MERELSGSALRVQQALAEKGMGLTVVELPASTRTAAEAARAVNCEVAQIAKSLVFRTMRGRKPVLVIASGCNRVDEKKVATLTGEAVGKAGADFARQTTGFAIGGIPPLGHLQPLPTFIDRDLLQHGTIWAAAGTPNALFRLNPHDLAALTGGAVADIKVD